MKRTLAILMLSITVAPAASASDLTVSTEDLNNIIAICGGGLSVRVDGDIQGKIAEAYEDSDLSGDEYVFERSGTIFSGATATERIALIGPYTDCIKSLRAEKTGGYVPPYPEPTEREMLQAFRSSFGHRLNPRTGDVVVENPINGIRMGFDNFRKHECRISSRSIGYACTYSVQTQVSFFSNEGSRAGQDHARAVQTLFDYLSGGQAQRPSVAERRFFKSGETWFVTE